jgi:hypothetical protein
MRPVFDQTRTVLLEFPEQPIIATMMNGHRYSLEHKHLNYPIWTEQGGHIWRSELDLHTLRDTNLIDSIATSVADHTGRNLTYKHLDQLAAAVHTMRPARVFWTGPNVPHRAEFPMLNGRYNVDIDITIWVPMVIRMFAIVDDNRDIVGLYYDAKSAAYDIDNRP